MLTAQMRLRIQRTRSSSRGEYTFKFSFKSSGNRYFRCVSAVDSLLSASLPSEISVCNLFVVQFAGSTM